MVNAGPARSVIIVNEAARFRDSKVEAHACVEREIDLTTIHALAHITRCGLHVRHPKSLRGASVFGRIRNRLPIGANITLQCSPNAPTARTGGSIDYPARVRRYEKFATAAHVLADRCVLILDTFCGILPA